jgi:hypothetical protein
MDECVLERVLSKLEIFLKYGRRKRLKIKDAIKGNKREIEFDLLDEYILKKKEC